MIGTGYSTFKEIEASDKKIYSDFFERADSVNKSLHEAISISQKFKKQRSLKKHFNFMQNLLSFFRSICWEMKELDTEWVTNHSARRAWKRFQLKQDNYSWRNLSFKYREKTKKNFLNIYSLRDEESKKLLNQLKLVEDLLNLLVLDDVRLELDGQAEVATRYLEVVRALEDIIKKRVDSPFYWQYISWELIDSEKNNLLNSFLKMYKEIYVEMLDSTLQTDWKKEIEKYSWLKDLWYEVLNHIISKGIYLKDQMVKSEKDEFWVKPENTTSNYLIFTVQNNLPDGFFLINLIYCLF